MFFALPCDFFNWNGPFGRALCPIIYGIRGEHLHHGVNVLVINHTEDDSQLLAGLFLNLLAEILPPTHIVTRVADHQRVFL